VAQIDTTQATSTCWSRWVTPWRRPPWISDPASVGLSLAEPSASGRFRRSAVLLDSGQSAKRLRQLSAGRDIHAITAGRKRNRRM